MIFYSKKRTFFCIVIVFFIIGLIIRYNNIISEEAEISVCDFNGVSARMIRNPVSLTEKGVYIDHVWVVERYENLPEEYKLSGKEPSLIEMYECVTGYDFKFNIKKGLMELIRLYSRGLIYADLTEDEDELWRKCVEAYIRYKHGLGLRDAATGEQIRRIIGFNHGLSTNEVFASLLADLSEDRIRAFSTEDIKNLRETAEVLRNFYKANIQNPKAFSILEDAVRVALELFDSSNISEETKFINEITDVIKDVKGFKLRLHQQIAGYLQYRYQIGLNMGTGEGKTEMEVVAAYLSNKIDGKPVAIFEPNNELMKKDFLATLAIYERAGLRSKVLIEEKEEGSIAIEHQIEVGDLDKREFDVVYVQIHTVIFDLQQKILNGNFDDFELIVSEGPVKYLLEYRGIKGIVAEMDNVLIELSKSPVIMSSGKRENSEALMKDIKKIYNDAQNWVKRKVIPAEERSNKQELIRLMYQELPRKSRLFQMAVEALLFHNEGASYFIEDGRLFLVGEYTGDVLRGMRYQPPLQQFLELKHGLESTDIQRTMMIYLVEWFIKGLDHVSGDSGTIDIFRSYLERVFGFGAVVIPPHLVGDQRIDHEMVFRSDSKRNDYMHSKISELHQKGHPQLIRVATIKDAENKKNQLISQGIPEEKIQVLSAREALSGSISQIVKKASENGMITIATDLGGRGIDVKVSADQPHLVVHMCGFLDFWSLIQIRGRSGRAGMFGESYLYLTEEELTQLDVTVDSRLYGTEGYIDLHWSGARSIKEEMNELYKRRIEEEVEKLINERSRWEPVQDMMMRFIYYMYRNSNNSRELVSEWLDEMLEHGVDKYSEEGISNQLKARIYSMSDEEIQTVRRKIDESLEVYRIWLLNPHNITIDVPTHVKNLNRERFWLIVKFETLNAIFGI